MSRPRKVESDRLFAARMLHESVARFESCDDGTGLDVMVYWSGKLHETLKLQEAYYASQSPSLSEQSPVGSVVSPQIADDCPSKRGPSANARRDSSVK